MLADTDIIRMLSDPNTCKKGFELLVRQYSESLYWKVRRIVVNHEDANDVLQNTFLKAWKGLGQFQGKSSLATWLYRIAVNEALDCLRHHRNEDDVEIDEQAMANRLLADEYFDGDLMQAKLQSAVAMLPEVQRTVFVMKYYEDMKYAEISEVLGTSQGALKASYHLAVKKIVELLRQSD